MPDTPLVRVDALVHDYGVLRALDALSCEIPEGSATALVGPNGAGKTTLMRCIAGLETPLSGAIAVAGIDVLAQPTESHRLLGFLADDFGVYQALTVQQGLCYAALSRGMARAAAQGAALEVAERLALGELLARPCSALSRGQRQRVAIGQALIHRPRLLILDEPASGLDPEARAKLGELLLSLRQEGMTLLVSSHILAELDAYCTHMLMLRAGRVVEHHSLGGQAASARAPEGRRTLRLELAQARADLPAWLAREAGLAAHAEPEGPAFTLAFHGDAAQQAALLRRLVEAGFAVSSLAEQRDNLQQSYLRSVRESP